jgi:hypothetical protein
MRLYRNRLGFCLSIVAGLIAFGEIATAAEPVVHLIDHVSGEELTYEIKAQNPTENVDGTPLTDLVKLTLYSCEGEGCTPGAVRDTYPTTESGAETVMPRTWVPTGNVGATRVIRYTATATDAEDSESAPSNIAEYRVTFITLPTEPNPPLMVGSDLTAFTVVKQDNRFLLLPIGTVPTGTACDPTQSVNSHNVVPVESVDWTSETGSRPLVVVAKCNG